jgi:type II secretory pathway pseudopilin PulG
MRKKKEVGPDALYWREGMKDWEPLTPETVFDQKQSAAQPEVWYPFEGPPVRPPWMKRNPWMVVLTVLAILGGITIFLLAWQKHAVEAEAEFTSLTAVKDDAQKFIREIKQGAAYTLDQWPEVAKALGITNMNNTRQVLGAPNLIVDDGFRWVYFDRLIHPVTELPSDLGISFDKQKNLSKLEAYP